MVIFLYWPLQKKTITYHNTLRLSPPKFCISINFSFSWCHLNSQEKQKTTLMQNFGVTSKEHCGMLWYFLEWSTLLGIARQWSRKKFAILILKPRSHVRILIHRRTWAITFSWRRPFGRQFGENYCPRVKRGQFRFMCVAQKLLRSLSIIP